MKSINTSDKSSGATSTSRISLLSLFLLFIALLQASSQLLALFFPTENEPKSSLLNVWLSLGNEMAKNWVAVSISLIFLVLGCMLYGVLSHKSSFPGSNLTSVGLLFINLVLCLRVYSNSSISEKIQYLAPHLPAVIIVSIIVFFVTIVILVIQKEQKNAKELDKFFHEASVESEGKSPTEGGDDNNGKIGTDTGSDPEIAFQLKHPFSYAYRSFAKDFDIKCEIKREHKKQLLQIKVEAEKKKKNAELEFLQKNGYTPENKKENLIGYISAFIAFLICIGLTIFSSLQNGSAGAQNIMKGIEYILDITDKLNDAEGPLTNFLLSSGVLFLFVVLILTFFLLVYTSLRVIAYLLSHPAEDTERIHRLGKAIKTFVLGTLDGALRPLLFLPDFLECLESMLLDTDMDKKIGEMYPIDKDADMDKKIDEMYPIDKDDSK